MAPAEYVAALARLGLTHMRAAQELGITRQSSHRYATGARPVPQNIAMQLRLIEEIGLERASDVRRAGRSL